jgi:hypothetical protein
MANQRRALARWLWTAALSLVALGAVPGVVLAHTGALAGQRETLQIPFWLFLSTGGGVVGASFLLASFVTDRAFVDRIHRVRRRLSVPADALALLARAAQAVSVLLVALVVAAAFAGPNADTNFATVFVWIVWWTGFTMVVYLVGNPWPAINPWRALVPSRVSGRVDYPDEFGAWPSVVGLLTLIWLEVVSPVSSDPRALGAVVVAYSAVTLAGAVLFGPDDWFRNVDPIANVFRYFGAFAPVTRSDDGFELTWPGARLADEGLVDGPADAGFLVALLWVTTFDGLVSTPTWVALTRTAVELGSPPLLVYLLSLVGGYALFLLAYVAASRLAVRTAGTARSATVHRDRFAASLLPIAVGYHLAHYLGYLLSLLPTIVAGLSTPFSAVSNPQVLVLSGWFGGLALALVVLGHLVAIWVAHAAAFDVFPDRLQAIRSQYPTVVVMVFYTMLSLWIVTRPSQPLPYL